jgi:hypothetical protein
MQRVTGAGGSSPGRRTSLALLIALLVLLGIALQEQAPLVLFVLLLFELLHRALILALPLHGGGRLLLLLTRPR